MLKKLLSTFLAVTLLMSFATTALAARKDEGGASSSKANDIFAIWGDFEHPNAINKIGRYSTGTQKIVAGGVDGSKNCLELSDCTTTWSDVIIEIGAVPGEVYNISFYVKRATETPTGIKAHLIKQGGGQISNSSWSWQLNGTDWQRIDFTFTCPSKDSSGRTVTKIYAMRFEFVGGKEKDVVYIDDFCAIPQGRVPDADYSFIETNFYGFPEEIYPQPARAATTGDSDFSDVASEHWANDAIDSLARNNYVNGIGDGLYSPNTNVTRAQFIKMVTNLYKETAPEYDGRFGDVSANQWFAAPIMLAEKLNLLNDAFKADGNIYPDKPITREEAAAIAAIVAADRGATVKSDAVSSFNDEADITDWAKEGVKNAAAFGMINGYEDGTYKPKNNITRAEAAQILFRIVEVSARLNIYVDDETGKDTNDGTKTAPLKSIEAARDLATKLAPTMQNDITIRIRGEQFLEETFELNETHSGKNGYSIVYSSWGDDKATITMNKKYTGFTLHDKNKNIWKTFVGVGTYSRQAYFNDVKGIRSRNIGYLENVERVSTNGYYFLCDNKELLNFKYPKELDMVFHVLWLNDRFLVDSISQEGDRVKIVPNKKYNSSERTIINGGTLLRGTPSYIENAYELLDEQGEWYLNKHDGYMYYIPRVGEDMSTMVCKIPSGENLIMAEGSDYDKQLKNVKFDNIIFEGTTWLYPDRKGGFHSIQGNYVLNPDETAETYASVHFSRCQNIAITNSVFRQFGFTGLDFCDGARNIDIIGNEFYNIGSSSMVIDDFQMYARKVDDASIGRPDRRPQETWCEYINVMNNYVHDIAVDFNGAAGITAGFPRHTKFHHNEVSFVPYSGFHLGWGWASMANTGSISYDLEVCYNYVHDVMVGRVNDGAAIYNLGATSPEVDKNDNTTKNKYIGNYFANGWNCDYVYPDNGSTNLYVANNVSDSILIQEHEYNFDRETQEKPDFYWMHLHAADMMWITTRNNYSDTDYSRTMMAGTECDIEPTKIVEEGNWPQEARDIMNNAGIEPKYRKNFDLDAPKALVCTNKWTRMSLGEPTDIGIMLLGHHNKQYPISDYDIRFWIEDDAATMDKNGYITALKEGTYEAEIVLTIGEITQSQHLMFDFGEVAEVTTEYLELPERATRYEFEDYAQSLSKDAVRESKYASNGKYIHHWEVDANGKGVEMSFEIDLPYSCAYDIEWALAHNPNPYQVSTTTLKIDGVEIGESSKSSDDDYVEDFSVHDTFPVPQQKLYMKLYREREVMLSAGKHTITLSVPVKGSGNFANFAADYIDFIPFTREVSASKDTVIEFDQYFDDYLTIGYKKSIVESDVSGVSGGKYINITCSPKPSEYGWKHDTTGENPVLVRTFDVNVEKAGAYNVDVIMEYTKGFVNGKSRVVVTVGDNCEIVNDGTANMTSVYPTGVNVPDYNRGMMRHSKVADLKKGINKITFTVYGEKSWGYEAFVTDYIKFSPIK